MYFLPSTRVVQHRGWFTANTCISDDMTSRQVCIGRPRLRAVSLFSWSVEQNAGDTQMTTRLTEGERRERHDKRETTRKASLRKHPFLLALRRWGRFARRNVCDSATEIPTDDVKSVRNPVRSADWSTQQFHCFSYCLWMTDKKQKATKVKCKREESLTKQSIFVEYRLLLKKQLNFAGVRGQINTTLYQNRPEDTQN